MTEMHSIRQERDRGRQHAQRPALTLRDRAELRAPRFLGPATASLSTKMGSGRSVRTTPERTCTPSRSTGSRGAGSCPRSNLSSAPPAPPVRAIRPPIAQVPVECLGRPLHLERDQVRHRGWSRLDAVRERTTTVGPVPLMLGQILALQWRLPGPVPRSRLTRSATQGLKPAVPALLGPLRPRYGRGPWAATRFPDRGSTKILFWKVRSLCPRDVETVLRNIGPRPSRG